MPNEETQTNAAADTKATKAAKAAATPAAAAPAEEAKGPQPLPEPEGGWPRDNYTGHFGRFTRDPFTGVRSPADEDTRNAMQALGILSATELAPQAP